MTSKELLSVTSQIGMMLLENGAEIYRVEDSVVRIAEAYGYKQGERFEIFAIPPTIIITVQSEDGTPLTIQRNTKTRVNNLDRVDRLNNLSRFICSEKPSFATVNNYISQIKKRKTYPFYTVVISYAVIGATFALFYGGGWRESIAGGIIAAIICLIEKAVTQIRPSVFFMSLLCSLFTATAAVLCYYFGLTNEYDSIIIGAAMTLVPGVTITNCMRDFIAGDFIAGLYTLIEALLVATGMAVGAAFAISSLTKLLGI